MTEEEENSRQTEINDAIDMKAKLCCYSTMGKGVEQVTFYLAEKQ